VLPEYIEPNTLRHILLSQYEQWREAGICTLTWAVNHGKALLSTTLWTTEVNITEILHSGQRSHPNHDNGSLVSYSIHGLTEASTLAAACTGSMLMLHDTLFPVSRNTAVFRLPACGRHALSSTPHQHTHSSINRKRLLHHILPLAQLIIQDMEERAWVVLLMMWTIGTVTATPGYIQSYICLTRTDNLEEPAYSKTSATFEGQITEVSGVHY
jgi:hypothetical protein